MQLRLIMSRLCGIKVKNLKRYCTDGGKKFANEALKSCYLERGV